MGWPIQSFSKNNAEVAHLVEHDLAKVGVAGSSPVFRSIIHTIELFDIIIRYHKVWFK
ncbi:MAG: hypothetical protein RIQ89_1921 [Bacteroidota bacterium]